MQETWHIGDGDDVVDMKVQAYGSDRDQHGLRLESVNACSLFTGQPSRLSVGHCGTRNCGRITVETDASGLSETATSGLRDLVHH